jgi:hypothetical protein
LTRPVLLSRYNQRVRRDLTNVTNAKRRPTTARATSRTAPGVESQQIIFKARTKPLPLARLRAALEPALIERIAATCTWGDDWHVGDYRFVVFNIDVDAKVSVYVQLWSEPLEPVVCEVSSGRWNPPADEWLAGERSERIGAFGFEIGGRADNFQRECVLDSPAARRRLARTIVDVMWAGFDYRGTQPLTAKGLAGSRTGQALTIRSVTPEDLAKLFVLAGYHLADGTDDEDAPVLRLVTRGVSTTVHFIDRVPDQNLFETAIMSCELGPVDESFLALKGVADEVHIEPDGRRMVLQFDGGVTQEWVSRRIGNWTRMIVEHRREVRKARKALRATRASVVH